MRTYVYIDGLNLYYGGVKNTSYKWLDVKALCKRVLQPHHSIERIKYFTARVTGKNDPQAPVRQQAYLHALEAYIPEIKIYYGLFLTHPVTRQLVRDDQSDVLGTDLVDVWRTEEKGSDVNLAVHLLNDAWLDRYDCAVVLSSDSDLAEAMKIARNHRNKVIGLLKPPKNYSAHLPKFATFIRSIRLDAIAASQLPNPIPGTVIHKPSSW